MNRPTMTAISDQWGRMSNRHMDEKDGEEVEEEFLAI
jgi:hypothetical protein